MDTVINIPDYDCENDDSDDCPICLSNFKTAEDVVHMQCCKKMMHVSCYINCITQKKQCPMCRKTITLHCDNISGNMLQPAPFTNINGSTIVAVHHPTNMMDMYSLQQQLGVSAASSACIVCKKYTMPLTIMFAAGVLITYYVKNTLHN
jgi:hypothetical protein